MFSSPSQGVSASKEILRRKPNHGDKERPKVSVILPTYNRASVMRGFLQSLFAQSVQDWELIIVDDGSTDETSTVVRGFARSKQNVRYIQLKSHKGLPHARNIGLRSATGMYVYMGEDDTILDKQCLKNLLGSFEELSQNGVNVGAIGPRILTIKPMTKGVFFCLSNFPLAVGKLTGDIFVNWSAELKSRAEVPVVHACSLMRWDIVQKIGYYDEGYIGNAWREDDDFSLRLAKAGYKLFLEPKAIITHLSAVTGGCRTHRWWQFPFYLHFNHIRLLKKFYGWQVLIRYPLFAIQSTTIWLLELVGTKFRIGTFLKASALIKISKARI